MNNQQRVFKNNGKRFEEDFKNSLNNYVWAYRPQDSGGGMMARFTHESLADLIVFNTLSNQLSVVELKSTLGSSVNFKPFDVCQNYENESCKFDKWKNNLSAQERKRLKEKIKSERKRIKELYKETNKGMIKYHQIKSLKEIHDNYNGKIKTYIAFTFFKTNDTFMLPIEHFYDFWTKTKKKSINIKDLNQLCQQNKCYKIQQEFIRRTMKSKYDLSTPIG